MIRDILLAPHPVLRDKAAVIDSKAGGWDYLVHDLGDTFDALEGQLVGLAANQIGHPYRALLLDLGGENSHRYYMFNPVIIKRSTLKLGAYEQCGSLPGVEVYVVRPTTVMVSYECPFKKKKDVRSFDHFEARILQHEIDHLDGILITDYERTEE